jgi:PAS domain S-box-containing protein
MAWVGLLDAETGNVNPVAHAGLVDGYLEKLAITMTDELRGQGPVGVAIRSRKHVIINDFEQDTRMAPWREDGLKLGYRAVVSLPLIVAGEARGAFSLYAGMPAFFDDDEVKILGEMAADLSFAMEFDEQEARRRQAEVEVKNHMKLVEEMRFFLQTTLDAFPANTAVLDPEGFIINVNAAWAKFADDNAAHSQLHYLASNYLTVCDMVEGADAEEATTAAVGIRAVVNGSQDDFTLEYPCHSPSEARWFALRITPFPEPAPRRVVVAHIDITERKLAEVSLQNLNSELEQRVIARTTEVVATRERAEAILSNSTDGILLLEHGLEIQQTNLAFNDMFAANHDDYFGKTLDVLVDGAAGDITDRVLQLDAEQRSLTLDVQACRKDGSVFDAELSVGLITSDSYVCTFHDIAARKQIEVSLRDAIAKERELSELKSRFVSMASHEFRTPLATIHAATETLSAYRERLTEEQIEQKLGNIRSQIGYLKDIMDDVLRLAQLQARRVEFNPETVDLDAFCRELMNEFQELPDNTHQLLYTCDSPVPTAQLDRKLLRQLMSNLLTNAIKYSPVNKTIVVNLEYVAEAFVLRVQDSGIGIPEDDLMYLFDPFHRASNVGTIHGTGLGLVIAKESVGLHGGTIDVESQLGVGTTFTIHIPVKGKKA